MKDIVIDGERLIVGIEIGGRDLVGQGGLEQLLGAVIGHPLGFQVGPKPTDAHQPGMELHAKYTIFAEGARGHLGKQVIAKFGLDAGKDPQSYGIGIKELWEIKPEKHKPGLVIHTAG